VKKVRRIGKTLCFLILLTLLTTLNDNGSISIGKAQTVGDFRLDQINWLGAREPGASNVPLQFQIMTLHNETITSIFGVLSLSYPFTDSVDGDTNATDVGETLSIYFNVSQYIVLGGEPFDLNYNLDIDENATKGSFEANLTITFFIRSGTEHTPGTETTFEIQLKIPNSPPELTWVRPTAGTLAVEVTETINFSVICFDEDHDILKYYWEVDDLPVGESENSFLFTAQTNIGVQEVTLYISDDNTSISRTWIVETQIPSETSIDLESQYLLAGTTTELSINLSNNLWNGIVDIELQDPAPLIVGGVSDWSFSNVSEGETLSFLLKIFTPQSALGATGAAVFLVAFSDEHGTEYFEALSIGLIIRGVIQISVFSSDISASIVHPGETIIISATLLNTGNTNALYTNASLLANEDILVESAASKSYLGELEPDSPLPFSLTAAISSDATAGKVIISCIVYYQDEFFSVYSLNLEFEIDIYITSQTLTENGNLDWGPLLLGSGVAFLLGGGTLTALILVIIRKRK
jgi:hypothetical protein